MECCTLSLDNALALLRAKKQDSCDHSQQGITEIVPRRMHCWSCGKEWEKK